MPRPRLSLSLVALLALSAAGGRASDTHLDPGLVPGGCRACHEGHGASGSPMLGSPQNEVCLRCHDSRSRADEQVRAGNLAPGAEPPLLGGLLALPSSHPLTDRAFSRFEPGAIVCASCHSPHRRGVAPRETEREGVRKVSPRNPRRFEFELCESCHGSQGPATRSLLDLGRAFDPGNRSFHPVHAPSAERSPSVREGLEGGEISCTSCHGSSEEARARGPHGSLHEPLLRSPYRLYDGVREAPETYALCYSCHVRERVLDGSPFELHRSHVVDQSASCATCHSAHGSIENRALVRFGEETLLAGVQPSLTTGRLAFVSGAPGSGLCYLTCHGVDHGPMGYGMDATAAGALGGIDPPGSGPVPAPVGAPRPEPFPGERTRPREPPPRRPPTD
ncbi:MAG TPA: cytochrome c3 family protein, partial [Thermoanaerobaculia bacterium]|nr:cytochrome c3 family protein [Thermoanaerobaculia bacterium]